MWMVMIAASLAAAVLQGPGSESQALTPGTVSVEIVDEQHQHPALDQVFAQSVSDALTNASFLILPGDHGRYIARVTVIQQGRGAVASRSRGSGAIFGGTSASVSLAKPSHLSGLVVTRLDIDLIERSDGRVVWSGGASTAQIADSAAGASASIAEKLAGAVIRRFPQKMDEPIAVP